MRKKIYGSYREETCPFCSERATTLNKQKVPVCRNHTNESLDLKCACGSWLDIKTGKFGAYCNCMHCGNMSIAKAMEINPKPKASNAKTNDTLNVNKLNVNEPKVNKLNVNDLNEYQHGIPKNQHGRQDKPKTKSKKHNPKETFITSDDVDLFYS